MVRFWKKLLIFAAAFLLTAGLLFAVDAVLIKNQYSAGYQASLVDKAARLQTLAGPKLILVGDSNVSFGFDSALLEQAVGMPVVNAGYHGAAGNVFNENIARLDIDAGDIVVVCHSDFADAPMDVDLIWTALEQHRDLWRLIDRDQWPAMLRAWPKYFLKALTLCLSGSGNQADADTCYARSAFNAYGDIVRRPPGGYQFVPDSAYIPAIADACVDRLNAWNAELAARGATLLVAAYPIADGEFTRPKAAYDAFEQTLRARLDCAVISHYTDYFYPYSYFYNSHLHLTEEGARARTEQLIADLQRWQAGQPA